MEDLPHGNNACVEVVQTESAQAFLEEIRITNKRWGLDLNRNWVFRGHANTDWRLRPSAWRPKGLQELDPLIKKYADKIYSCHHTVHHGIDEKHAAAVAHASAQLRAVEDFATVCDDIGKYIPEMHEVLADQFWQHSISYQYFAHDFKLSTAAAFAQHHGIPTALLDWTRDPFVAAYFATEENEDRGNHICVWAFDTTAAKKLVFDERLEPDMLRVHRHNFDFLHAQDAEFLFYPRGLDLFRANGQWPCIEDEFAALDPKKRPDTRPLVKFTLPASCIPELSIMLYKEKRSLASLKPTYDNASETAKQMWSWNRE